jgi:hypothetical protein
MELDLEIGVAVAVGIGLNESPDLIGVAPLNVAEAKFEVILAEISKADKMKRLILRGVAFRVDAAEINPVDALGEVEDVIAIVGRGSALVHPNKFEAIGSFAAG